MRRAQRCRITFDGVTDRLAVLTDPNLRQRATNWALVPVLAAVGWYSSSGPGSRAALLTLAAAATLPLALRRRFPAAVLVVVATATGTAAVRYDDYWPLGAVIAVYTVAAYCDSRGCRLLGAGALMGLMVAIGVSGWQLWGLLQMAPLLAAWIYGENVRTRSEYLRAVEDRAAQLEREQDAHARRAAAEEQTRIAREVHDVIAHNLSVIVVQATAGDAIFESQPHDAQRALRTIERTARQALDELRRVVAAVRDGEQLTPQPGLGGLSDLVEDVRLAGLPVQFELVGEPRQLPVALELSAYRIVQEALTNTLRHADAKRVDVTVSYLPDALQIEIVDDGRAAARPSADGNGIVGIRERTRTFAGEFEAGPIDTGGFRVQALLPVAGAN